MKYELDHCKSLLKERKLILICDLDETLISAIYLNDNYLNSNFHKSIVIASTGKQVKSNHVYIKLRPHLTDFLEKMGNIFELHLMSMGTASHVKQCVEVIDPTKKYFGNRITSRENIVDYNKAKATEEMFPGCSNIIICLDDNMDTWNYSPTLVSIKPFNYFVPMTKDLHFFAMATKEKIKVFIDSYLDILELCLKDNILLSLQSVLEEFHDNFFKILDEENSNETRNLFPKIKDIMSKKK